MSPLFIQIHHAQNLAARGINIKTINRIYLQTIAKGIYNLTESQFSEVSAIAHQCPLLGGKVVYSARSLYALRDNKAFDDAQICEKAINSQDRISMPSASLVETLKVVPNPASDILEIFIPQNKKSNELVNIRILSSDGRLVAEQNLSSSDLSFRLGVSKLASGLYICLVSRTGVPVQSTKFVIQH